MDAWLPNTRPQPSEVPQKTRKGKGKVKEGYALYPLLEPGAVTSATLQERDGRLVWSTIQRNDISRRLVASRATLAFPATRAAPLHVPQATLSQRAEQGAHFLRTFYPDVDIPAELIRDHVASESQLADALEAFDPYLGNRLAVVYSTRKRSAYVAFPMGENACDLNISTMEFSANRGDEIIPVAQPVRSFETPICQVVASPPSPQRRGHGNDVGTLAVRTFSSVSFLSVAPAPSWSEIAQAAVVTKDITNLNASDLGGRQAMDVQLSPLLDQAILINDQGEVYRHDLGNTRGPERVYSAGPGTQTAVDAIWRVSFSRTEESAYSVMSAKALTRIDLRTPAQGVPIYSIRHPKDLLTSMECGQDAHMTRLVTTNELLWFDDRNYSRPIMAYRHGRAFDRTLYCGTVNLDDTVLTVLSSRKNNLLTVYDVSRDNHGLVQGWVPPYTLPCSFSPVGPHDGYYFIHAPPELPGSRTSLLQLSLRGGIHHAVLTLSPDGAPVPPSPAATLDWPADVRDLDAMASVMRPDHGKLGARDVREVDLRPAYQRLFQPINAEDDVYPEEDGEEVYQTLEKMPTYFQDCDEPSEQVLTTFDIAFRSGEEPSHASRADFLTRSTLSTKRGYRALEQGRVPRNELAAKVPWKCDILPILKKFDPDVSKDVHAMAQSLRTYDLAVDDYRSGPSLRREAEARDQLAVDLALSTDIYSAQPFRKPIDSQAMKDDAIETMPLVAETISPAKTDDPPPIQFSYLNPIPSVDHYTRAGEAPESAAAPPGVRLLLREWAAGSDPDTYAYYDPYGDGAREPAPLAPRVSPRTRPTPAQSQAPSQPQRPPLVVAARPPVVAVAQSRPPVVAATQVRLPVAAATQPRPPAIASSQPLGDGPGALRWDTSLSMAAVDQRGFSPGSQELMASTQVVPGPFGGRLGVGKKKAGKKRVGGF
ncbi:hypothetical protein BV25DRAFT_1800492 [Artomyces pyxidatus]|uniref:Uncharacterized protein n=1 Tax=Artomyces pyxidatus TaxID=48021 RepID=A0ACB8T8W0_9AGAM|nr:hypothetical protein BV25DRAFT_1800492 [Artomyces pyxidatus]